MLKNIDAVILVGGYGRRLKTISKKKPKPLVTIKSKPFLHILINKLKKFKFRKIILSTYYQSKDFEKFIDKYEMNGVEVFKENKKLGTLGSIVNLVKKKKLSNFFFVCNGDTYLNLNIYNFFNAHKKSGLGSYISCVKVKNVSRYGNIIFKNNKLLSIIEKKNSGPGWINAGNYFFKTSILNRFEVKKTSLEKNFLNTLSDDIGVYLAKNATFFDIGTPKDYKNFKKYY